MVRGYHRRWHPPEQFSIPLLTGHEQHSFQRKLPVQGEMTNRFAAGCQAGKNIQIPMATQKGLGLQSGATQSLTHQIKKRFVRLPQQEAHLPGALMRRLLQCELILQIVQGSQHPIAIPVRINPLLPMAIQQELFTMVYFTAGTTDPHLRRWQV